MTMHITSSQLKEYQEAVSLFDKKKSEIERSREQIAKDLREQWKTIECAKKALIKPISSDLHNVFDNRKLFYKIIEFLSETSISIMCRVQNSWNHYVVNCITWPLRVYQAYPNQVYVLPSTSPKTAKVFFSNIKTLERMGIRLNKVEKDNSKTLSYFRRTLACNIATPIPVEITLIALAALWPLFLIESPKAKDTVVVYEEQQAHKVKVVIFV